MSTLENTVSMMKTLPEADEAADRFLKPVSREDIMRDIEIAEVQFASGEYQNAREFLAGLRKEYGV
ncbi:MAG: hypothetical protein HFH32_03905 [Eubacterium sp.]|nr:hypothetical protein [Eubacterium sp.]